MGYIGANNNNADPIRAMQGRRKQVQTAQQPQQLSSFAGLRGQPQPQQQTQKPSFPSNKNTSSLMGQSGGYGNILQILIPALAGMFRNNSRGNSPSLPGENNGWNKQVGQPQQNSQPYQAPIQNVGAQYGQSLNNFSQAQKNYSKPIDNQHAFPNPIVKAPAPVPQPTYGEVDTPATTLNGSNIANETGGMRPKMFPAKVPMPTNPLTQQGIGGTMPRMAKPKITAPAIPTPMPPVSFVKPSLITGGSSEKPFWEKPATLTTQPGQMSPQNLRAAIDEAYKNEAELNRNGGTPEQIAAARKKIVDLRNQSRPTSGYPSNKNVSKTQPLTYSGKSNYYHPFRH